MKYDPVQQKLFGGIQFYIGIVDEVLDDYVVTFRIPNIADNLDKYPKAYPTTHHNYEILPEDEILVLQMNTNIYEFIYFPYDRSKFTGIRIGTTVIDLGNSSNDGTINIKVLDSAKEKSDDDDGKVLTSIVLNDKSITLSVNDSNESMQSQFVMEGQKVTCTNKSGDKIVLNEDDILLKTMSGGNVEISKGGIIDVSNNVTSLGTLLNNMYTNMLSLYTTGSPTTQSGATWAAAWVTPDLAKLPTFLKV